MRDWRCRSGIRLLGVSDEGHETVHARLTDDKIAKLGYKERRLGTQMCKVARRRVCAIRLVGSVLVPIQFFHPLPVRKVAFIHKADNGDVDYLRHLLASEPSDTRTRDYNSMSKRKSWI